MPEQRDLVAGIARVTNLLNRRAAPVLEKANITPQQWGVLSVIADADGPLTLAAVARQLAVTKQNMTGMVNRLEQLGLIERVEHPSDLRSSRVQLTRRGRSVIDRVKPSYEEWLRTLGADRDVEQLARAVNRLIARLEEG